MNKLKIGVFVSAVSGLSAFSSMPASADTIDESLFSHRAGVTFPGYTLEGALENFPVLVRLTETEGGFSYATSSLDGSDIRFALSDGTILNSEVSLWNTDGESQVWVSIPSLASGTSVYMYWGGPNVFPASQTDGSVWTNADYVAVWHMDEMTGSSVAKDSAGGALNGTYNVSTVGGDGKSGRAVLVSDGEHQVSDGKGITTSATGDIGAALTFTSWLKYKAGQNPGVDRLVSTKPAHTEAKGWEVSFQRYNARRVDIRGSGSTSGIGSKDVFPNNWMGSWQHIAVTFNGGNAAFFLNGQYVTYGGVESVIAADEPLVIGNDSKCGTNSLKGWLDEVRLRKGKSSDSWISTEYNSVNNASFAAVGDAEPLSSEGDIPALGVMSVTEIGRHSATISWTLYRASADASASVTAYYGTDPDNLSNSAVLASGAQIATGEHVDTLSGLPCVSQMYVKIVATGADGDAESSVVPFVTVGAPVFAEPAGVVDGMSVTISGALSDPGPLPLNVAACFGADPATWTQVYSWTGVASARDFEAEATASSLGNYSVGFSATATCPDCGHTFNVVSPLATVTVFGDCRWTGGANDLSWNTPGNWSSGTVPGPKDTAIFGTEASLSGETISLGASQTVAAIQIDSADAFTIGSADDNTDGFVLSSARIVRSGGAAADVGTVTVNAEFDLAADTTLTVAEGAELDIRRIVGTKDLVLDGDGTVKMVQAGNRTAGKTEVKGGVLLISNDRQLGKELYIGGAGKIAVARSNGASVGTRPFGITNNKTFVLDKGTFDLEADGISGHWEKEAAGPISIANGGTFLPGKRRVQFSISGVSDLTIDGVISGGVGGTIDFPDTSSLVVPETADAAPVIQPHLTVTQGVKFDIGDIPNFPIDATISGGISYGWHPRDAFWKKGAGVLRLTGKSTYGGGGDLAQGQGTTQIQEGTLLVDNDPTVYGSGTGNSLVRVDGGAVLGGTGRIGGLTETVTHWSGHNGTGANTCVKAAGTAEKQAVVWPGTIDDEDGSHVNGTLSVGVSNLHHSVTFGDYSTFKASVGSAKGAFDALVVYGAVSISPTTKLVLVPNCEPSEVRGGTYTILSATEGITNSFAVEGVEKPSGWRVNKVNARQVAVGEGEKTVEVYDALTVTMAGRGLAVFIR